MPTRHTIDELVSLQARTEDPKLDEDAREEAFDAYHDAFGWIDWRGMEHEVVEAVAWQLDEGDELTYIESINAADPADSVVPIRNGVAHRVPLTGTGSDRYVMLHSLAEILKDRYEIFMESDSAGGSDTHGALVLPHAMAADLRARHGKWMKKNLSTLDGIDGFSGLAIPWLGHEDAAPEFTAKRQAMEARTAREGERMKARIEAMFPKDPGGHPVDRLGFAIDRMRQVLHQQKLAWTFGLLAVFALLAFATPWAGKPLTGPSSAALLAASSAYHAWTVRRMYGGAEPNLVVRMLPAIAFLVIVFSAPGLLRA
jgi:hypothetical protein